MQSDDACLLMEENLNGDAMAYFKRIEIYQKLRQTDRQTRLLWKGEVERGKKEEFTQQTTAGISELSTKVTNLCLPRWHATCHSS